MEKYIKMIEDKDIKKILEMVIDTSMWRNNFNYSPGAIRHHHNHIGGLRDHTVEVVENVIILCDKLMVNKLERDYLIACAIIHDYGKLYMYTYDRTHGTIDFSDIEDFVSYGDRAGCMYFATNRLKVVRDKNEEYSSKINIMIDLIDSHHGITAWGSTVNPWYFKDLEHAWILFVSDYYSSCSNGDVGDDNLRDNSVGKLLEYDCYMVERALSDVEKAFDILTQYRASLL